jgi:hypothetical protein
VPQFRDSMAPQPKNQPNRQSQQPKECPVPPGVSAWSREMPAQKAIVTAVGLPGNVEDIPEHRNRTNQHTDPQVRGHARQRHIRNPADPRRHGNDQ